MSEIELLKGVRVFDVSQGMAQGKNNQVKLILSLSFMPYALSPMPLRPAKPFNSDLALRTQ